MKPHYYFCETFTENFWFFLGWKTDDVEWYMKRFFTFDTLNLNGDGKTVEFQNDKGRRVIIIWTRWNKKEKKIYSVLAHECVHAAHMCLSKKGVKPDFENDEVVAYMVQSLMRKAI